MIQEPHVSDYAPPLVPQRKAAGKERKIAFDQVRFPWKCKQAINETSRGNQNRCRQGKGAHGPEVSTRKNYSICEERVRRSAYFKLRMQCALNVN
jgi:hypothetical protein